MSFCLYLLPPDQQVSPGARTALAPLAPFHGIRYHRAPWDLNRVPFHPRPGPPPYPPSRRPDVLIQAELRTPTEPRRLSGLLTVAAAAAGTFTSVSNPIPFPFELTSFALETQALTPNVNSRWSLWIIDYLPTDTTLPLTGDRVIQPPATSAGFTTALTRTDVALSLGGLGSGNGGQPLATVTTAGRRIALQFSQVSISTITISGIWQARELLP